MSLLCLTKYLKNQHCGVFLSSTNQINDNRKFQIKTTPKNVVKLQKTRLFRSKIERDDFNFRKSQKINAKNTTPLIFADLFEKKHAKFFLKSKNPKTVK